MRMQEYLPILASVTALLAVFVGPFIQLMIARDQQQTQSKIAQRQQRASMVSSNRIRWIEDFRREIAEFIAACHLHEAEKRYLADAEEEGDEKQIEHYRKALDASFFRVNTPLHLIRLKIDPEDPERTIDAELWKLIKGLDKLDVGEFEDLRTFEAEFDVEAEKLRKAVRRKLSPEWERVERLE